MLIIREATILDIDGIVECAERFFDYAKQPFKNMPFDRQSFVNMMEEHIQSENSVVILLVDSGVNNANVVGGICGFANEWGFNNNIKFGIEVFYWVDEKFRGIQSIKMLKMYEDEMKRLGVQQNIMISVNTHLADKVGALYNRMGYELMEKMYVKAL